MKIMIILNLRENGIVYRGYANAISNYHTKYEISTPFVTLKAYFKKRFVLLPLLSVNDIDIRYSLLVKQGLISSK